MYYEKLVNATRSSGFGSKDLPSKKSFGITGQQTGRSEKS